MNYNYLKFFLAQTLSRSIQENDATNTDRMRRTRNAQYRDPRENYNESKLMNALFARYYCAQ